MTLIGDFQVSNNHISHLIKYLFFERRQNWYSLKKVNISILFEIKHLFEKTVLTYYKQKQMPSITLFSNKPDWYPMFRWLLRFFSYDVCHWTSASCNILTLQIHYWIDWAYLLGRHHQKKCETCFVDNSFSATRRRIIKSRQISLCLASFFPVQIKDRERERLTSKKTSQTKAKRQY